MEMRRLLRTVGDKNFLPAYGIIRALRRASAEHFARDAIQKTRDDARAIIAAIDRMDQILTSTTLSPEIRLRLSLDETNTNAPGYRALMALGELRHLCQMAESNQPKSDQILIWCARIAFTLMHQFTDEVPTSGSPRSTYRILASLLYEILSGEAEHDLKRACDDHLRGMRALRGG